MKALNGVESYCRTKKKCLTPFTDHWDIIEQKNLFCCMICKVSETLKLEKKEKFPYFHFFRAWQLGVKVYCVICNPYFEFSSESELFLFGLFLK